MKKELDIINLKYAKGLKSFSNKILHLKLNDYSLNINELINLIGNKPFDLSNTPNDRTQNQEKTTIKQYSEIKSTSRKKYVRA